jgi:RIO kinase 1
MVLMDTNSAYEYFNELDETEQIDSVIDKSQRKKKFPPKNPRKVSQPDSKFLHGQDDSASGFKFTYKAARFEEWWLLDSLGDFYEHKWISDVRKRVKGGKEASVYMCTAGKEVATDLVAAKVYRPRSLRNLKNDHVYRAGRADFDSEGRKITDKGMAHAMYKKTEYGQSLLHQSWIAYEFTTLEKLHAAGADVPQPYTMAHNAILMSFIGDLDGCAPALSEISLDRQEAKKLFDRALANIDMLLSRGVVHGDLSAYNILYWEGAICLIDFPQVVSPLENKNALSIFQRDVFRVCDYFSRQGVKSNARKIASEIWTSRGYPLKDAVDVRLLDENDPKDGEFWKAQIK